MDKLLREEEMKKERKCKYCGNRKLNTGSFCSRCGKPLYVENKTKRNGGIAVILVLLSVLVIMVIVSIRAKDEYTPAGDHIFEGDDINAKSDETRNVTNEEKESEEESQEVEEDEVDVMNYLTDYESLESILQMQPAEYWQFPDSESYVTKGFYLEWIDNTFSMKNEGNSMVTLYGIHMGDETKEAETVLLDHGWTDCGYGTYITIIDENQYYIELQSDESGKINFWYLNNWPEGEDLADAFDALEENTR